MFGGERGIRTLDTGLPYTRFPGVLLQPLGHLTSALMCCTSAARNPSGSAAARQSLFARQVLGYRAESGAKIIARKRGGRQMLCSPIEDLYAS
jgi:hypothetical protein